MQTFFQWLAHLNILARLQLAETYVSFDPSQYNQLFHDEMQKLSASSPEHREAIQRMRGFNWVGYIAKSLRNAGYRDQREVAERTHDIVAKLLTGTLFRGFDERTSGPMDLRFKRAVANGIKNLVEKEKNRRRFIPTVPMGQTFEPGSVAADQLPGRASAETDERVVDDFRQLVRARLGNVALAALDTRLAGQETKSLVGRADLGSPGRFAIKRIIQQIKALAREFAERLGDPGFLRDFERAMGREAATVQKRLATGVR